MIDELDRGRPVLSAFQVFSSTWTATSVARTGVIAPPQAGDDLVGTVAVTIVDVDEGARVLRFAHTWGPSWGDRGFGTIAFETAKQMLVFDQLWSVELEPGGSTGFSWELTAPARPPLPPADPAPAARPPAQPAARPPAQPAAQPPGPTRVVHDGRGLGASYATLDPATILRQEGGEPSSDPVAEQVFDALGAFHRCLREAFDRDSWDGEGAPYSAIVHYGRDYDNAFWDPAAQVVVLGDGDGRLMRGFYSLDIVAKEYSNALIGAVSRLTYQGQSGALYNALALGFAAMVTQHAAGQTAAEANWLIGTELLAPGVHGTALANLLAPGTAYDDPGLGKDPAVDHLDRYVKTAVDGGGIHVNYGIPARAFALAARTVAEPTWKRVGPTWFAALSSPKLKPAATFAQFAGLTLEAAPDPAVAEAVAGAWREVGVRPSRPRR
jgi:hypothetical protein